MGTYSGSSIVTARRAQTCAKCAGQIERGAQKLTFKLGLKRDIHLHVDCALQNLGGYRCHALEQEAKRRVAEGTTCRAPCVGYRCCLPAGHAARLDHQWILWDPTSIHDAGSMDQKRATARVPAAPCLAMKKQHRRPCAQCPFRRAAIPGFLGGAHPDNFLQMADADVRMPCHLHLPEGVSYEAAQIPGTREHRAPQCAGRAIYWRNQAKLPRDPILLVLDADSENVFGWPQEFREHHREAALRFWQRLANPPPAMEKEREVGMDQEESDGRRG